MTLLEILPVFSNGREETDTMDMARRNESIISMSEIFDLKCYNQCKFQYLSNDLELIKQIVRIIVNIIQNTLLIFFTYLTQMAKENRLMRKIESIKTG